MLKRKVLDGEAVPAGMEMQATVGLGLRVSRWRKAALGQKRRETGDAK